MGAVRILIGMTDFLALGAAVALVSGLAAVVALQVGATLSVTGAPLALGAVRLGFVVALYTALGAEVGAVFAEVLSLCTAMLADSLAQAVILMFLVPCAAGALVAAGGAGIIMAHAPAALAAMLFLLIVTDFSAELAADFGLVMSLEAVGAVDVFRESCEGHDADQQNSNHQQTEHLLHYCFHFVSNLLMKLYMFEIVSVFQIAAFGKWDPFADCSCTDAIFISAL
jgi:hypothetical protein